MKYRNPPITEALVEVVFDEPFPDAAVGGRFYEGWKDRCVRREPIHVQQFHVHFGPPGVQVAAPPPVPTERLWLSENPAFAIQVGPSVLSVHFVRQPGFLPAADRLAYPGFDKFAPHVLDALNHYRELVQPVGVRQVTMRYINAFPMPTGADGTPAEWLQVGVLVPDTFAGRIAALGLEAVVELRDIGADLRYVLRMGQQSGDSLEMWLDIQVTSRPTNLPNLDSLERWLRAAHDEGIIGAFEGSITDQARTSFEVLHADAQG